jgi:hypothetical protein
MGKGRGIYEGKIARKKPKKEKQSVLGLFNFVIVNMDRMVDTNKKEAATFLKLARLMEKAWEEPEKVRYTDDYESAALELIRALRKLREEGFNQADYIFSDIQELFCWEFKDASRRWKLLTANELQEIRLGASKGNATVYLHLLFPWLERNDIERISLHYGLAVKTADDLIDWHDDLLRGFINVPKEEIDNLHGVTIRDDHIELMDREKVTLENGYIKREFEKINELYRDAAEVLDAIIPKSPARKAFKDFMHSWLRECRYTFRW